MATPTITSGTIIRTIVLIIALANQVLTYLNINPLPFEEESIQEVISLLFTAGAAIWAWWKNNDITKKARNNSQLLQELNVNESTEG